MNKLHEEALANNRMQPTATTRRLVRALAA
jgi:hypothetical protein